MTMPEEVYKRRMHFARLMMTGSTIKEAADTVSQDYNVSVKRLCEDWANRDQWGFEISELRDRDKYIQDHLFALNEIKRRIWAIILDNPKMKTYQGFNNKEKYEAMKTAIDLEFRGLQAAQSLGTAPLEPQKHIINVEEAGRELRETIIKETKGNIKKQEEIVRILMKYAAKQKSEN